MGAEDQLEKMTELDITKGVENLYVANYCRLNGCKIIYADELYDTYENLFAAKLKVQQIAKERKLHSQ